jgi:hypothetical protein
LLRSCQLGALGDPERRLVTLVGPGGIGKSRLAIEAANLAAAMAVDFANGIFFVPLADVSSPRLLSPRLATSLGSRCKSTCPTADELFSLVYLGAVLRHGGDYEAAWENLAEGLQLARTLGDDYCASRGQAALPKKRRATLPLGCPSLG